MYYVTLIQLDFFAMPVWSMFHLPDCWNSNINMHVNQKWGTFFYWVLAVLSKWNERDISIPCLFVDIFKKVKATYLIIKHRCYTDRWKYVSLLGALKVIMQMHQCRYVSIISKWDGLKNIYTEDDLFNTVINYSIFFVNTLW